MRRRTIGWWPALALCVLAGACAHDISGWKKVSTDHFVLYTDLRPRVYESVLERLQDVQAGLASSFFGATATPPLEVFLFGEGEFHELAGQVGGLFIGQHGKGGVLAVYDGWDPHFIDRVAGHELAHGFIAATFPRAPVWFHEGFATYLESIIVEKDRIWFGSLGSAPSILAGRGQVVPMTQLFSSSGRGFHGEWEHSHYATSWALFHYLLHGENKQLRPRFDQFNAAVAAAGDRGDAVWRQVYPEIPLAELDGRVRDHVSRVFGRHVDARMGFALARPSASPPRVEPAEMARVEAMRAALRSRRRPDKL